MPKNHPVNIADVYLTGIPEARYTLLTREFEKINVKIRLKARQPMF